MPEVSVVIPSYNHAAYLAEAVGSALAQAQVDLELIVVDDGSTDRSLEILSGFSDPRLRVISQTNQGAHAAINRGLREATGEFLAILNSDDVYDPRRLETVLAAFRASPKAGFAGSHIEVIDSQGRQLGVKHGFQDLSPWQLEAPELSFRSGSDLRAALLTENYWSTTSNFVFRRDLYDLIGEFRPLRFTHDWDFALRAALMAGLVLLPEPLLKYRIHPHNTIRENQAAMVFEILWCLAVHIPRHLADPEFYAQAPEETRVEQLLHSIYTFDCGQVLEVMLLQRLHENETAALRLLEPGDQVRGKYLDYIRSRLAARVDVQPQKPVAIAAQLIKARAKAWLAGGKTAR
jgi:glycosyltransferase involved in cell wall biosynthesis